MADSQSRMASNALTASSLTKPCRQAEAIEPGPCDARTASTTPSSQANAPCNNASRATPSAKFLRAQPVGKDNGRKRQRTAGTLPKCTAVYTQPAKSSSSFAVRNGPVASSSVGNKPSAALGPSPSMSPFHMRDKPRALHQTFGPSIRMHKKAPVASWIGHCSMRCKLPLTQLLMLLALSLPLTLPRLLQVLLSLSSWMPASSASPATASTATAARGTFNSGSAAALDMARRGVQDKWWQTAVAGPSPELCAAAAAP
mmetsp:Transcript_40832/g.118265  ORF Transcript_40832/g.118265 Transcript_40832/m.118265 type:complete len:257 (+) Transcript_40832:500-1270(+)